MEIGTNIAAPTLTQWSPVEALTVHITLLGVAVADGTSMVLFLFRGGGAHWVYSVIANSHSHTQPQHVHSALHQPNGSLHPHYEGDPSSHQQKHVGLLSWLQNGGMRGDVFYSFCFGQDSGSGVLD